jgi:DNA-binding GntR family transcriptional regulator
MADKPSPQSRAEVFLRQEIAKAADGGTHRLPSIKAMAAKCGVASMTFAKALARMRQAGLLDVVDRPGIYVRGLPKGSAIRFPAPLPTRMPLPEANRKPRWAEVKSDLLAGIISSRFTPGAVLPSAKELCRHYGSSHDTVKYALRALVNDGKIRSYKRGYQVSQTLPQFSNATLVILSPTDNLRMLSNFTPRSPETWRYFERRCFHSGIKVHLHVPGFMGEPPGSRKYTRNSFLELQKREFVIGYAYFSMMFAQELTGHLLRQLGETGKPLVVIDEVGVTPQRDLLPEQLTNPLMRVFSIDGSDAAGKQVGDYLLSLGHRGAACFSLVDSEQWCRIRADGLGRAFNEAGLTNRVRRMLLEDFTDTHVIHSRIDGAEPYRTALADIMRFEKKLGPSSGSPLDTPFLNNSARPYFWSRFLESQLRPSFDRALADRSTTAWVGISDIVALVALDYLGRRGVKVPQEISVIGFDDGIDAIASGLTSYNFNTPAIVDRALEHILTPPAHRAGPAVVEIPGVIMSRRTTGPAKTR